MTKLIHLFYWLLRALKLRPKAVVTVKDGKLHVDKLDPGEKININLPTSKKDGTK